MSSPQTVATVVVFDYLKDPGNNVLAGTRVDAILQYNQAVNASPQVSVPPVRQTTETDANGYWQFNLAPNPNLNPTGTTYVIRTPYNSYEISVPTGPGPYQATAITVSSPIPLGVTTGSASIGGALTVAGDAIFKSGRPWADPIAFGADPTGVSDSTAAFTAALATSNVRVSPGTYLISSPLVIGTNQVLAGAGRELVTLKATGALTGKMLDVSGNNAIISDLSLNGNAAAGYGIYFEDNSYQCIIESVLITNVTGTPGYAVANADRAYSLTIQNLRCTFNNLAMSFIKRCQNLHVYSSQFYFQNTVTINGVVTANISIGDGTSQYVSAIYFHGCDFEGPSNPATVNSSITLAGVRAWGFEHSYVNNTGTGSTDFTIANAGTFNQTHGSITDLFGDGSDTSVSVVTVQSGVPAGSYLSLEDWWLSSPTSTSVVSDATGIFVTMINLQGANLSTTGSAGPPILLGASLGLTWSKAFPQLRGTTTGLGVLAAQAMADTNPRWELTTTGSMLFGSGSASLDATIQRQGAAAVGTATNCDWQVGRGLMPSNFGSVQSGSLWMGSGVPSNTNGTNGDIYFNTAGGSLTTIYQKRSGSWVGIV